jgi:hypothetical protein
MKLGAMITVNPGSTFSAEPNPARTWWMVVEILPAGAVPARGDRDRAILSGITEPKARLIAALLNGQPANAAPVGRHAGIYHNDPIVAAERERAMAAAAANLDGLTFAELTAEVWRCAFEVASQLGEHDETHTGTETDCEWCARQCDHDRLNPARTTCARCSRVITRRPGDRYITDDTSLSELCDPASGSTHQPVPVEGPAGETCQHCSEVVYWRPDGWVDRGGGYSCSARPTDQPATFGKHQPAQEGN